MKKQLLFMVIILLIFAGFSPMNTYILAETKLDDVIDTQLNNLELEKVDEVLSYYKNLETELIGQNLKSYIEDVINGKLSVDYMSIIQIITAIITEKLKQFIPIFVTIAGLGIMLSLFKEFNLSNRKDIEQILHIAFMGIVVIIISVQVTSLINITKASITGINGKMQAIFPILITIMTALGSKTGVSLFQPIILLMINIITNIFLNILLPVVILNFVICIVSDLSDNIKLENMSKFCQNFFKWSIGFIFTIFTAFTTINGIGASGFDSISIRTAKYTVKSYVPIIGGYLADSFNIIMAGSVLIKNALGLAGLIMVFSSAILPVITIIIFKFGLELTSAVLEPICDKKLCNFLSKISSILTLLVCVIVVCSFMYLILITLIMSVANTI